MKLLLNIQNLTNTEILDIFTRYSCQECLQTCLFRDPHLPTIPDRTHLEERISVLLREVQERQEAIQSLERLLKEFF